MTTIEFVQGIFGPSEKESMRKTLYTAFVRSVDEGYCLPDTKIIVSVLPDGFFSLQTLKGQSSEI